MPCSERRKIERRIRRLEKSQRASSGQAQDAEVADQLTKLKEDLEYVRVSYVLDAFLYLLFWPVFVNKICACCNNLWGLKVHV